MGDQMRSPNTDFYGILGISKTANICKAYKSLVTKWNPDKNHSDKADAEVKFQELNDAYKIEEKNISEGSFHHKSNDESFMSRPAVLLRSLSKMNNRSPGSNPSGSNHGNSNGSNYHGNINSPQPETSQSKTNTIKDTVTLEELFDSSPSSSKSATRRPSETKERSRSKSTTRRDPSEGVSGRSKSTTRRDPSEGVSGRSKSTTRRDPSESTSASGRSKSTTRRDPSESTSASGRSKGTTSRDPSESTSASGGSKSTTSRDPSESTSASGGSKSTSSRDPSESTSASGGSKSTTRRDPSESTSASGRSKSTTRRDPSESTSASGRSKRRDPSEGVSGRSKSTTGRDPSDSSDVSGRSKNTTKRDPSDSSDVSGRSNNTTRRSASDTDFPNMSGSVRKRSSSTSNIVYSQSTARRKPAPIETKLECTLEELCFGCVKHIQIKRDIIRQGIIEKEEEIVKIKIQAGWKKGTKITFEGKGDEKPGYYPADIIFSIEETTHPLFQRIADDLEYGVEIPLVNALTGCSISIPLLGGEKMSLKFDDIIYPGYEKIIPGQGMPLSKDDQERRGNLRIQFLVKFPVELSDEQRSLALSILQDCS